MQRPLPPVSLFVKYLQGIFFTLVILWFGKTFFVPLLMGLLIAMIMYPISRWLELHGWGRPLAITACLLIVTILIAALVWLLVWQVKMFSADAPLLFKKAGEQLQLFVSWVKESTGITLSATGSNEQLVLAAVGSVEQILQGIFNGLVSFFLVPVYTALFMYHRTGLVKFMLTLVPEKSRIELFVALQQTAQVYFNYIKGMILVYILVGILNSAGLFIIGVQHAVLFGMLCAVMTIIPYFGIIISALLPISSIWLQTGNVWYAVAVVGVFTVVQYLEANVIFPKVVGRQLHINTLVTLTAIIAGGVIWGVEGMILFIPFLAIIKIASDHIESWKPLQLLLGRND